MEEDLAREIVLGRRIEMEKISARRGERGFMLGGVSVQVSTGFCFGGKESVYFC